MRKNVTNQIDEKLYHKFKIYCVENKKNISDALEEAIKKLIEKEVKNDEMQS